MKKIILLVLTFAFYTNSYSQTTCPESIKSNSTPSEPTFVLSNGQNGCNEVTWPLTIFVDGLTYSYVSCSGGNLKYAMDAGQTAPTGFDVTVDYGNGLLCSYDANGLLDNTLSNQNFYLEETVAVFPNPINSGDLLNINLKTDEQIEIELYSIIGKLIYSKNIVGSTSYTIDVGNLKNGVYLLRIKTDNASISKKIIISK